MVTGEILEQLRALEEHTAEPLRAIRRELSKRVCAWEPRNVVALGNAVAGAAGKFDAIHGL